MAGLICNKYPTMLVQLNINPATLAVESPDPDVVVNWIQRDGDWIQVEIAPPEPQGLVPEPETPWPQ